MKTIKKSLFLSLSIVTLFSSVAFAGVTPKTTIAMNQNQIKFSDLSYSHWAVGTIERWSEDGVITGYEDGTIKPDNNITRAEFIAMISRIFMPTTKADLSKYTDVESDAWYYETLAKAVNLGIINGVSEFELRPNDLITRQEAMTILARLLVLNDVEVTSEIKEFTDDELVATWAKDAVDIMTSLGYVGGYEDGSVRPESYITRAEVSKMLDKSIAVVIREPGTYELGEITGNIVVASNDVVIKNTKVSNGKIYTSESVKKVTLDTKELKEKIVTTNEIINSNGNETQAQIQTQTQTQTEDVAIEVVSDKKETSGGSGSSASIRSCTLNVVSNGTSYDFEKTGSITSIETGSYLVIKVDGETIIPRFKVSESNLKDKIALIINDSRIDNTLIKGTVAKYKSNATVKRLGLKILVHYPDPEVTYDNLSEKSSSVMKDLAEVALENLTYSELLELANEICK